MGAREGDTPEERERVPRKPNKIVFRRQSNYLVAAAWSVKNFDGKLSCVSLSRARSFLRQAPASQAIHALKIKVLKSKFECCSVSSCSRSVVPWEFQSRQPSESQCFPPCCSHAEVSRISLTLVLPDLRLERQNLQSQPVFRLTIPRKALRNTSIARNWSSHPPTYRIKTFLLGLSLFGLYEVARHLGIEWVVIRGISDFTDEAKSATDAWKPFASVMAASLTAHILTDPYVFSDLLHYGGMY